MIYVTSDLHGYPLRDFQKLLIKAGFGERKNDLLYVLGDVIDRNGDGGIAALDWISRREDIVFLRGNHEDMMLKCAFLLDDSLPPDSESLYLWYMNGAEPTISNLGKLGMTGAKALLDYVRRAPLVKEVTAGGRSFVLSHTAPERFRPDLAPSDYSERELLWSRPNTDARFYPDRIWVFGHTPVDYLGGDCHTAHREPTWIDIDTCAAAGEGFSPMILRLDDMKETYA